MALEDNDVMRDDGISRGIGTSPLISQRIQRNNIEENRSLGAAIAESKATLENEREKRLLEARKEFAKQQSVVAGAGTRTGSNAEVGGVPRYVIETSDAYRQLLQSDPATKRALGGHQAAIASAGNGTQFVIKGNKVGGGTEYFKFSSAQEVQSFLETHPELAQSLVGVAGDPLELGGLNVPLRRVSADDATGLTTKKGGQGFAFKPGVPQKASNDEAKEVSKIGTKKASEVDFSKISRNTQAKMFDAELTRAQTLARSIPPPTSADDLMRLSDAQRVALVLARQGSLSDKFKVYQTALRAGYK